MVMYFARRHEVQTHTFCTTQVDKNIQYVL